jgi:hypothetical protein
LFFTFTAQAGNYYSNAQMQTHIADCSTPITIWTSLGGCSAQNQDCFQLPQDFNCSYFSYFPIQYNKTECSDSPQHPTLPYCPQVLDSLVCNTGDTKETITEKDETDTKYFIVCNGQELRLDENKKAVWDQEQQQQADFQAQKDAKRDECRTNLVAIQNKVIADQMLTISDQTEVVKCAAFLF